MFPNARDREFSEFFQEISGSWEMAFGNADLYCEAPREPTIDAIVPLNIKNFIESLLLDG